MRRESANKIQRFDSHWFILKDERMDSTTKCYDQNIPYQARQESTTINILNLHSGVTRECPRLT